MALFASGPFSAQIQRALRALIATANTWVAQVIRVSGIGTTSTDGVVLENTTDAAAGAQQYSPRVRFRGEGWKTDATAASQTVDFAVEVQPVQGTSAPTGNFILKASINGGAYSTVGTFTSGGQWLSSAGTAAAPSVAVGGLTTGLYASGTQLRLVANALDFLALDSSRGIAMHRDRGFGWSSSGITDALDLYWVRAAAGSLQLNSASGANTFITTLADWGTTLSPESVTVADAGTLNLGAAPLGLLTISVGTDNIIGRFQLRGSSNAVVADDGNDAIFTTTKDTATSINVYFDTNAYFIQNTRGGNRALRVSLVGA